MGFVDEFMYGEDDTEFCGGTVSSIEGNKPKLTALAAKLLGVSTQIKMEQSAGVGISK